MGTVRRLGIETVFIDREIAGLPDADVVLVDNAKGAAEAITYLLGLGHRRVGIISGPATTTTGAGRLAGYHAALHADGVAVDEDLILIGSFKRESGAEAVRRLLSLEAPPTAIFAANNVLAESALFAIRAHGLAVPDDISLIMFDDVPWASLTTPPRTVVAQPTVRLGMMAVEQLIQILRDPYTGRRQRIKAVLQPTLVLRGSCAPPARSAP